MLIYVGNLDRLELFLCFLSTVMCIFFVLIFNRIPLNPLTLSQFEQTE